MTQIVIQVKDINDNRPTINTTILPPASRDVSYINSSNSVVPIRDVEFCLLVTHLYLIFLNPVILNTIFHIKGIKS